MRRRKKVLVIGLDSASPELVFDQWRDDLPNFKRLMDDGVWGKLESCIPAITVPAWSSMMASQDPGTLGVYGFHNRGDYSYQEYILANSNSVKADRVWDILSRMGVLPLTVVDNSVFSPTGLTIPLDLVYSSFNSSILPFSSSEDPDAPPCVVTPVRVLPLALPAPALCS